MNNKIGNLESDFANLARLALTGRAQDVSLFIHKASKRYKQTNPTLSVELVSLLKDSPTRSSPLRKQTDVPLPVDLDSRLHLLRIEHSLPDHDLVLPEFLSESIQQLISEQQNVEALGKAGLQPTRSVLFSGPPGVGKTMSAKWIASKLNRPLLILDLSAVMSSYLGRTGNNIRFVLDYAKSIECILLIDELDAIAKRRDDQSEIGELKRLVTVLLQELDDWPSSALLLAATNHPDLLDPAVWRRFEMVLTFEVPSFEQVKQFVSQFFTQVLGQNDAWIDVLSLIYVGKSFSEIERRILSIKKRNAIQEVSIKSLFEQEVKSFCASSNEHKKRISKDLIDLGLSQRRVNELTGIARETIRKSIIKKS